MMCRDMGTGVCLLFSVTILQRTNLIHSSFDTIRVVNEWADHSYLAVEALAIELRANL